MIDVSKDSPFRIELQLRYPLELEPSPATPGSAVEGPGEIAEIAAADQTGRPEDYTRDIFEHLTIDPDHSVDPGYIVERILEACLCGEVLPKLLKVLRRQALEESGIGFRCSLAHLSGISRRVTARDNG